jgi:iron(III) transport system ATP-binding protein
MIRPAGVQLCPSDTGEHHVTGTVADVAFRGRGYEHAIDIPGHARLTSVFSDPRAERGELVGLRLDPRGCHLFRAGPGALAGPARPAARPRRPSREWRRRRPATAVPRPAPAPGPPTLRDA